ncbi:MAG: hypothetical protein V1875_06265 [Candidatus Altiarchaeota archaeon]
MSQSGEKRRQNVFWPDAAEGQPKPPTPPATGEPMPLGAAKAAAERPADRQLSIWDSATGGLTPEARNLVEDLQEFKDFGLTETRDAECRVAAREWVFGLGRSRMALRVVREWGDKDAQSPRYSFTFRDYNRFPDVVGAGGDSLAISGAQDTPATAVFSGSVKLLQGKGVDPNTWDFNIALPEGFKGFEEDEAELSRAAIRRISEVCNDKAGRLFKDLRQKPRLVTEYEEEDRHGDARTDFLMQVFGFREAGGRVRARSGVPSEGDRVRLEWTPEIDRMEHFRSKETIKKPR